MIYKVKLYIYHLFWDCRKGICRVINSFLFFLIVANVFAVILETLPSLSTKYNNMFFSFEIFSVFVFSIEYVLRLWSCTINPKYRHSVIGRLRYALSPLAIIDLIAILPFYIPFLLPFDLRFLRIARVLRVFRIFKIGRYSKSMDLFIRVIKNKEEQLIMSIVLMFILLVISSCLIYFLEHEIQPDVFDSIPSALWWGVVTLSTVGYGDIYPITPLGKIVASITSILGVGIFALPAGILASGFIEEIQREKKTDDEIKFCPYCGKRIF